MPREVVTLQVGQCGNQIGCRFWELALKEHASISNGKFDDSLSTFFRNVDTRNDSDIPMRVKSNVPGINDEPADIWALKARAILVDMESGVINSMLNGRHGGEFMAEIFDHKQVIHDVSGAGNNWAHGFHEYGPQYDASIREQIRTAVEKCDSLQWFLILQSIGGGTGSGLGTYILRVLEDYFPEVFRFVCCVTPSKEDDVITSPYNAVLAMDKLINYAHCVLPVSNDALINIVNTISSKGQVGGGRWKRVAGLGEVCDENLLVDTSGGTSWSWTDTAGGGNGSGLSTGLGKKPYDWMNMCVAQMLNHLTSSMRYDGALNLDLNEITMNLVPYPRMHFLMSALSPLHVPKDVRLQPRSFDAMFNEVLSPDNMLIHFNDPKDHPKHHHYLAQAFLVRS